MKIVSFNINGIRARLHQLEKLVQVHAPDIIGLQETKVQDAEFPLAAVQELGYDVQFFGQKGHYGVALLSKQTPVRVQKGFASDPEDAQRRLIGASYDLPNGQSLVVLNGYFPQGESRDHPTKFPAKLKFYQDLRDHLRTAYSADQLVAVIGDWNISPQDIDIGIGADNAKRWLRSGKCSFLPEERAWLEEIAQWGLVDTFRVKYPDVADRFSWFDYRSRGFDREPRRGLRIDLVMVTPALAQYCRDAGIDYELRSMVKPSDHCPIWATFDL